MHPPCEMMTDSFLPAMRGMVAVRLRDEGYSQGRIAALLGVTQASVSLYLRSRRSSMELLDRLGLSEEDGLMYASILAEDLKKSPVYAVNTLYSLWADALGKGSMCAAHREGYPSLAGCDLCVRRFGPQPAVDGGAVEKVASAVRMLEASSVFVRVMPEVSVNIAFAPEGASSPQDVVAVPGRIVRVKGMPRSFMRPEYGASTHVASVLLAVISKSSSRRAAMNIKLDPKVESEMRKLRLQVLRLDGRGPMLQELRASMPKVSSELDAVVDPGGEGTEAGLYLFAQDPAKVAELGLRIARGYPASRP
jgi:XRE family transcriptional regulator, thiamine biosynthesis regulator